MALRLQRGERLRIIDLEGGQTGDLVVFSPDGSQRLSNGRTFDYGGKVYLSTGDVLWSDRSEPMLTIVADQVGKHDFLYAPCSLEMYRKQYGVTGYHPNCHDNLCAAPRRAARARAEAGAVDHRVQFLHGCAHCARRHTVVRAAAFARRRLVRGARGDGPGGRGVGVSGVGLQRRRAAAAAGLRAPARLTRAGSGA